MSHKAKTNALKKAIAYGIGYKNPKMVDGKYKGTAYEYPIYTKKHMEIVKRSGGKIKE